MSVAKDCQRYAVRCLQRATVDPRQKTFWLRWPKLGKDLPSEKHMPETVTPVPFLSWIAATDCLLVPGCTELLRQRNANRTYRPTSHKQRRIHNFIGLRRIGLFVTPRSLLDHLGAPALV